MALSGNKGEWSELYTFFKLLADGKICSGDGHLNVDSSKSFPILKVFRSDDINNRTEFEINEHAKNVLIKRNGNIITITQDKFRDNANSLLNSIKQLCSSGEILDVESFMYEIGERSIKASSSDKADIRLVIHDLRTGTTPELGYSIKSRLGGNSTLINSNKDSSNFVYEVENFSESSMDEFNSKTTFNSKTQLLNDENSSLRFCHVASGILQANLDLLDTSLAKIIGECLKFYYTQRARTLEACCNLLNEENPLGFNLQTQPLFYQYKIKQFLLAFALGMTVGHVWNCKFNANGGYIIVKEDGDVVCYHFFDRNDLEDYLFYNTVFDTPSTTRHDFGKIFKENDRYYLKLNLQIRFL